MASKIEKERMFNGHLPHFFKHRRISDALPHAVHAYSNIQFHVHNTHSITNAIVLFWIFRAIVTLAHYPIFSVSGISALNQGR